MSYNSPFTGNVVQPTDVSFREVTLSANTQLAWPINGNATDDYAARIMQVTATAGGLGLYMPPANQTSVGNDAMIRNVGSNLFTVYDFDGVDVICTLAAGEAKYIYITDNPDEQGTWGVIGFGAGSSSVDAGVLAGYGLLAITTTLNQSHPVTTFSSDATADATYRAQTYVWTGGAGTLTLTSAPTLGNNWFMMIRNGGTGTLNVSTTAPDLFDGSSSVILQVGDSCLIVCSGTAFYSVGLGRSTQFNFTQLTKPVVSGTYTLTPTEASNVILKFTGTLTGNVTVIVPQTVQVYYVTNQTDGTVSNYTVTLETGIVGAASAIIPAGNQATLICDSVNLFNANTVLAGATSLSIIDGTVGAPAINFANETTTGIYRAASGQFDISILGTQRLAVSATGISVTGDVLATGTGNFEGGVFGGHIRMTQKVFALDTKPGIQRDGTVFDKQFYNDGRWVRFQRGRPRKMGGYQEITNQMNGPSRGMWVNPTNGFTSVFSGYSDGLQVLSIDGNGVGSGVSDFTLNDFTPSPLNMWQFDGFYDVAGAGVSVLLAHPGQNLSAIDSTADTPVLVGDINGYSMSKIGVFTDTATLNATTTVTLAATNPLIGAGQLVTGTNIPANTYVVSVSTTTVVLSNAATGSGSVTLTFDNEISVSGGVVSLHPYVFVYGNNGLIRSCSAGNTQDWVSADCEDVNVATGKIVQGLPVRGGSNAPSGLFWSLDSVIRVSFIGGTGTPPQYWRADVVSSQSSIMSSQSVIEYDGIYYWCGVDRFMMYNGVVKEVPNNMNQNYFFDNLNYSQRQKVWAQKVPRYGEIWWFYPRGDATECTDAIVYNVRENTWYDAGEALGARRSAGYFSQVFHYPINAAWDISVSRAVTAITSDTVSGSYEVFSETYNSQISLRQAVSGSGIPDGTTVSLIQANPIKTLGSITGGSLYTNGTYTGVALTGGIGFGAEATIVVSGNAVTSVTITDAGAGYGVGDILSAAAADIGGTGSGFSVPVTAVHAMGIIMSNAATATASGVEITFSTPAGQISIFQHEIGTDEVKGQQQTAIESYFETNDLGLVSGGPAEPAMIGENLWLHVERIEPDFLQNGEMELYVTGRPYAQIQDKTTGPYTFQPGTGKIDLREQRRELRLKFRSNVSGGDYQLGRLLVNADSGDVRGYSDGA